MTLAEAKELYKLNKKALEWRKREAYYRRAQDRAEGHYKALREGTFLNARIPVEDIKPMPIEVAKAVANRDERVRFYAELVDRMRLECALARAKAEAYERQWATKLNEVKAGFAHGLRETVQGG